MHVGMFTEQDKLRTLNYYTNRLRDVVLVHDILDTINITGEYKEFYLYIKSEMYFFDLSSS